MYYSVHTLNKFCVDILLSLNSLFHPTTRKHNFSSPSSSVTKNGWRYLFFRAIFCFGFLYIFFFISLWKFLDCLVMFLDKVKQIQRAQSRPEGPPTRSRGPKGPKNSKIPHFQLVLTKFLSEPVPLWEWILKPAVVNIDFIFRIGMFGHFTAPSLCMSEVYIYSSNVQYIF